MATTIWKGHLSFGLVSIPVKLYRAARAEKVAFRQVHEASGSRVRQALYREPEASFEIEAADEGTGRVAEAAYRKREYRDPVSFAAQSGRSQPR